MPKECTMRKHDQMLRQARQLRRMAAPMEARLWEHLRNKGCSGFKFRRQAPIGQFIADFVCFEARLIVELDGDSHTDRAEYDAERTSWLDSQGFIVLRFTNAEVRDSLEGVFETIRTKCSTLSPLP
jgi:very-short-patch-repair endonuclease